MLTSPQADAIRGHIPESMVSKSRGQSNRTCRAICDLSMPTFAAFVVANTRKSASCV